MQKKPDREINPQNLKSSGGKARKLPLGIVLFCIVVYLFFPVVNSTIDAWYYAAAIRHGHALFLPHHLLYNAFYYSLVKIAAFFSVKTDILAFTKILNSLFAGLGLLMLQKILERMQILPAFQAVALLITGFSFGYWRFAIENETYVLPLSFSLIASFCYLQFLHSRRISLLILSGVLASLAALFHQIHIAWWLGLAAGLWIAEKKNERKNLLFFGLTAFLIPLAYLSVWVFYEGKSPGLQPLLQFILHDFTTGEARIQPGIMPFLLTPVNLFRSFFQLHGDTLPMLKTQKTAWLITGLCVCLTIAGVYLWKTTQNTPAPPSVKATIPDTFRKTHIMILLLHILMIFIASGNAEFTAMIPPLFFILLTPAIQTRIPLSSALTLSLIPAIWNCYFGILPRQNPITEYLLTQKAAFIRLHPDALFILNDKPLIENLFYYETGKENQYHIENTPAVLQQKGKSPDSLYLKIKQNTENRKPIFTDLPTQKNTLSRHTFAGDTPPFPKEYTLTPVPNPSGNTILWEVR
ncbi:MAG: hypothetical protein K1X92_17440 [Bacteroidia bacterium]|nr:hypothetical protein [Bacteroidia bacterium]